MGRRSRFQRAVPEKARSLARVHVLPIRRCDVTIRRANSLANAMSSISGSFAVATPYILVEAIWLSLRHLAQVGARINGEWTSPGIDAAELRSCHLAKSDPKPSASSRAVAKRTAAFRGWPPGSRQAGKSPSKPPFRDRAAAKRTSASPGRLPVSRLSRKSPLPSSQPAWPSIDILN